MDGDPRLHLNLDPAVLFALAGYAGIYVWRFRAARREAGGRGAGARQALAFAGALTVLLIATVSPLDALGEEYLFSAHMVQHLLLGDIAPLLTLLALSRVILRPATRRLARVERALGPHAHPVCALVLFLALTYVWHIPALYNAALEQPPLHALEHASFFTAGTLLWWPLIQPVPMRRPLRGLTPFAYLGAAKAGVGLLGVYLVWSSGVAYSFYEGVPRIWGLSAIEDQNAGGALMMVEQSVVLALALVVLFARMLVASERDQRREERLEEQRAAIAGP
jgi:cytochrome c oxidase assembly factor CtaG